MLTRLACLPLLLAACAGPRWGKVATTDDGAMVRAERGAFVQNTVEWFELREISGAVKLASYEITIFEDVDGDGQRGDEEPCRRYQRAFKEPSSVARVEAIRFDTAAGAACARYSASFTTTNGRTGTLSGRLD